MKPAGIHVLAANSDGFMNGSENTEFHRILSSNKENSMTSSKKYIKLRNNFLIDRKQESFLQTAKKTKVIKRGGYQSDASAGSAAVSDRNQKRFSLRKIKRTRIYSDLNMMSPLQNKSRSISGSDSFENKELLDEENVQTFNINDAFK